jgi:serine protease Do
MNTPPNIRAAAALAAWLTVATMGPAVAEIAPQASGVVGDLAARTTPAFVFVSGGSGVLISADGLVLSNAHVVGKQRSFNVRLGDGRACHAKLLGYHTFGDLALLQIEGAKDLPFLPLGDSDRMQPGAFCFTIGNPLALGLIDQQPTISTGVISAKNRLSDNYVDALVIDAPINPGNSGGPLINAAGELIGINGKMQPRMGLRSNTGLGFAVPVNRIKRWLPLLQAARGGAVRHGRLEGIEWQEPGRAAMVDYVAPVIRSVAPGSDGDRAGFKAGDTIVRCQGEPVRMAAQMYLLLAMNPHNAPATVVVRRDGAETTLTFTMEPVGGD